ncbi:helix-turn-helix domain-containing protein [Micromonospora carbonacea]|uniref:DNA binding domain-containing protein, excisionase family n=1 Tax=Micromonospora carbonacea TaxID=47853 RepID=A0A1C4WXB7_9ACTN|nr:helix-turn-helix domain-containing protein [Micromonospora carbonacea]SCF00823.1 DNA binding domain-containing protein, excisionase family [Micromonospora carbonacea]
MTTTTERQLTIIEAAAILGVATSTAHTWATSGRLPGTRTDEGWRVPEAAVRAVAGRLVPLAHAVPSTGVRQARVEVQAEPLPSQLGVLAGRDVLHEFVPLSFSQCLVCWGFRDDPRHPLIGGPVVGR